MAEEKRVCQNCKQEFTIEPDDFGFYEKIKVPPPTFCPRCRVQRRFVFRNERFVYKRKSDYSGKEIFAGYANDAPVKVFETDVWDSDQWDAMEYGRDIDWEKPFLEQLLELHGKIPRPALGVINMENSDYCNNASAGKNCYMLFNFAYAENCLYGTRVTFSEDSMDCSSVNKSSLVYDSFQVDRSSRVFHCSFCEDSSDVYFSRDLKNCHDCFGCVGLRNKQYCISNEQYSKEEYFGKLKQFPLGSFSFVERQKKESRLFWNRFPVKFFTGISNSNVSGEYLAHSKNVFSSYIVEGGENVKYSQYLYVPTSKEVYDHTLWGEKSELTYECMQVGDNVNNVRFTANSWPGLDDIQYCIYCKSNSHLFGCVGLKKKEYCILNKQYSKEEYEALVPKIIQHMKDMPYVDRKGKVYRYGEFLPPEFSPFAYNETIAQEFFPLTKEEAVAEGYRWRDAEKRDYRITKKPTEVPDDIKNIPDSIVREIIGCAHEGECNEQCTEAFRITPDELSFYRRMEIPVPHLCPSCRHVELLKQRNLIDLWHRKCQCAGTKSKNGVFANTSKHAHGDSPCPNEFETSYAPDRPEIVYCEACYNAEVA